MLIYLWKLKLFLSQQSQKWDIFDPRYYVLFIEQIRHHKEWWYQIEPWSTRISETATGIAKIATRCTKENFGWLYQFQQKIANVF